MTEVSPLRVGAGRTQAFAASLPDWRLRPGELIKRTELHRAYGGSPQEGISPSAQTPNVFLFSDEASGRRYGYVDGWSPEGTFLYTGRGQHGDQRLISGNKAIAQHAEDGRALRLFEGTGGTVRYAGEFAVDEDSPFDVIDAPQVDSSELRKVFRFRLRPVDSSVTSLPGGASSGVAYRSQDETVDGAEPRKPRSPDPDSYGRGFVAHKKLQNDLADLAKEAERTPLSPAAHDPDFDLAWRDGEGLTVVEVKSLTHTNQVRQLRLGLGQVLDYADVLGARGESVRAVLHVEQEPTDQRWIGLAGGHGVRLTWPASAKDLFE